MSTEDKKWLYGRLGLDLNYDEFEETLSNDDDLQWYYDRARNMGLEVGTYDEFNELFGKPVQVQPTDSTYKVSQGRFGALVNEETPEEKAERRAIRQIKTADKIAKIGQFLSPVSSPSTFAPTPIVKESEPKLPTPEQIVAAEDERLFKQHLKDSGQIQDLYNLREYARENDGSNWVWDYINPLGEKAPIGGAIHLLRSAFSEDYRDKKRAQKQNRLIAEQADKAIDVYEQATGDRNGISSVFNAIADEASRISTWDLGMTDLQNAATLYDLSQRDESELTASEKATLDAIGLASSVMSLYGDEVGAGYKIGQGIPATLSFMGSMALNPAAGYGKKLAGDAVKKFGKDYVKRVAKRAAGDILETGAYVGSVALPQVAANTLDRINGSTTYDLDDDLNVVYGGQEDQEALGNAIWKAFGETFIEGYTERVGDYFDPIIGFAKGVTKGIKAGKLSDFAEALVEVKPTATMQNIRRFKEKTLFNGTLSELMEEELGMIMNAYTVGDYTFDKEEAERTGKTYILDPENQFVTGMSVGMFSAAINGTEMAANHAYKRKVNKVAEKYGKMAERELGAQFSEMIDGVPSLKERIDNADADEKYRIFVDILGNPNLNDKQKAAVAQYAIYRQYAQTFNAVQANALNHKMDEVKEQHAAYEAGYSSALPAFYNIANAFKEADQAVEDYTARTGKSDVKDAIRLIENNPSEIKNIRDGLTDEQYQLVINYKNTLERYKGAYQGRSDKLEDYMDEVAFVLEPAINADANGNRTITTAIYKDEPVYVTYNDGTNVTIMRFNGEKLGDKTPLLTQDLSEIVSHDAEQYINDYRRQIKGQMDAETENASEHHPKTQVPQKDLVLQSPEGKVVITAVNDNMVEIVPAVYKDGQVQPKEGAEPKTITVDDAYAWQDSYYQGLDDAAAATASQPTVDNMSAETAENEGTPTEEIEQSVSEVVTDGQNTETQPTETESVTPAAPQTARERVPKDEKGNPIYEQTDADTAWDAIVEETEGDTEMAQSVAEQMLANKKAALEKLQKGKAKAGANVAQIIANEKKRQEAISKAEADVKAWERIAQVNAIRQQKAELERAEAEKAEAEQRRAEEARILAEQEEQARIEREQLNGVPDMVDDTPQDARARGFRRVNGHKVDRQEIVPSLQGKEVGVKFANDMIANGRVAVIEAETLQPSHLQGQRNPAHFIDEAQPKERNDEASIASARQIASNIRPEEITTSVTAYTGAPTVNMRGEAIQGNSRSDALRVMWAEHPDQSEKYKQYLIDRAEEFGLNAEEVAAMQHPVLVNMLDVSDTDAINLGQYVAQDTESGGIERIKPKNVARKMGSDIRSYANILLRSSDEEASFSELVDKNGVDVLKWMNTKGYITPTQYASSFDSKGDMTAEAKNDLRGILYQSIFQGGNTQLEEQFNAMPAKAQKATLATAYRDYDSPESERMVGEIQSSIRAYYALSHDRAFVDAKNYKEAKEAMLVWSRQYQMDDVTGESFLPSENFSNFALELAVRYKGNTQSATQNLFNELFDLIQGTKEASLFEEADNRPRTLAEAIKETLNIDYNGQNGSNALVGDDTSSQEGRQGSTGDSTSGELSQNDESAADDRGRTAGDSNTRPEETGGVAEVEEPSVGYILDEGEKESIEKATISQLKNHQRTLQANLAIIDRIEKNGKITEELVARRKRDIAWLKAVEDSLSRKEKIKAKNKWGVKSGNNPVPLDTVKQMFAEWNENADIQALFDRDTDDASRYEMWEQQLDPLRKQMEDVYAELEGLYSLEAEAEEMSMASEEGLRYRRKDSTRRQERNRINNNHENAVSLLFGIDKKKVREERIAREKKRREDAKEIYDSVLSGDFNDVTLQKINDYIDDATPQNPFGRRISQRLPQKLERGLHEGARTNAVDALFSRISESAVPANERISEAGRRKAEERKKELLKGWAIATGNWHTDLSAFVDDTTPIGEGADSKVYLAKDGAHVIKTSKGKPYGKRFRPDMDNIALFNRVFYNSRYEIVGYGELDGEFVRILKQPIVDFTGTTPLTPDERVEYMKGLKFEPINDSKTAFSNGEIVISDLQKSNIVKDAAGNISVIDADAKLHTKDVGGNYTYPPVEADLPQNEDSQEKEDIAIEDSVNIESRNDAEIIAEVERESANLGVQVRIARSIDELPDDTETRKRAEDGSLKGVYSTRDGEVVVYLPNTENANDAKRTILHEIVGHKGLRSLIGEQQYDKAMLQLMYMLPADVRDAVLRRAERHGWNAAIAMDEYLAEQAERDVQPTWWGKVNAKIRALLRNLGFDVKLTDADVTYLLWRSRKKLQGDNLNDMAVNAILKQAARKSAEAEAWNEQAFKDAEMRDFERNTLPSVRHRMGADVNDYEKTVRTLGFKQAEAWQDHMRSLLVFQQTLAKASGKDISDFENAYMYENRMSSANLMEMEQYRHMVYNSLLKAIHELEQMDASRESIINYLFAKSGLERNEVFARRDAKKHAEGDAAKEQQLYDKYRQKDYAGLTALTRGDAQIAALVDDHSKKKTEYERLEQNKKLGVAVSDADLKAAKKEMNDARKAMIAAIETEAQRMVDEFEAQHNTDNLWDKIRNCTHTTLNISHDAGVMSDEVYNELWNQFQYYIPLRGFAETTAEDMYLYLGGNDSPYNAPIKAAYGRTSLADDPIATIGNMAESAIVEANRNRLKQRFLYMVERHNTDLASISDVWLEYDEVNDEWHTVFAQIPDDATPSEAKRLQQEFEDRMKLLAEQNPGKYANASQQPNIPYRVVKKGDRQEHHVIVKRNGKDVVITINGNPRVAQAINGLTNPEQNQGMITRITSWINRNLSANFTMRNPAFMVSNFVRDGFYTNSMVWVKENPAYARQYNKNWAICTAQIASLVKRYKRYEKGDTSALDMNNDMDRMFYEFMINGGETGYTVIKSVEDYKGLISGEMKKMEAGAMGTARRVADTIGNVVDTFGRWAEDTSRFAAYMTSRQMGRTITKSIWDAKEISVNFNKKGSGNRMMGKFEQGNRLNYVLSNMSQLGRNLYVFWNAGMQGLNNFKNAAKKSPAKFTAMAGTYFTLGVIVAAAFSGDDDEDEDDYYNLPEYVRRNNICFKIGKGKYATLPLPIEIRAIYGLGELAYSYLSGREGLTHGEAVTKTIQQITQVLPIDMMADGGGAMALVPSAAKPVVEVIHNVDWTGRPIYKEKTPWNQNDPTWTLAFKSTSPELVQMSRLVNEWTNKNTAGGLERPYNRGWADNRYLNNPAVWEHIMEGYLGGMATMFNQTKKTLMMPFNEDLREVRNVPIVSRFIKDAGKEGRSYAARNEYYDAKNIMDSWKNEMSKAKKEVLDESLTDEQRLKAAKLRSSLEQQYTEAAERWKVLDRQRKALEEAYKSDQSEDNRQALDDVMMQMATLVEAYRD